MTDYMEEVEETTKKYFETHKIPDYFYQCFFGELVKIYGVDFIAPDEDYDADFDDNGNIIHSNKVDYSYRDQIDFYLTYFCGTGGWNLAFREACKQCYLIDLLNHYTELDWFNSDVFDCHILDNLINVFFNEHSAYDYYRFKMQKEN